MIAFLTAWLEARRALKRWTFVGTVEGAVISVEEDGTKVPGGNQSTYWNLYERGDGVRKYDTISPDTAKSSFSYRHTSQAKRLAEASVQAWTHGGPLPVLYQNPFSGQPARKPAKLLLFQGGKDGAE